MTSTYMPSVSFVAKTLYEHNTAQQWSDAPDDERDSYMLLSKTAMAAIQNWQVQVRGDGSKRYVFEMQRDDKDELTGWAIFDRKQGFNEKLGVIHDALLAQQIVDDLNKRDNQKKSVDA